MQWDAGPQAGFSSHIALDQGKPQLQRNQCQQAQTTGSSILHYYQKLIRLRKENPVMVYGSYDLILPEHEQIYAFTRTLEDERLLVILNFSKDTPVFAAGRDPL